MSLTRATIRHWLAVALITSAAMLAIAHGFETFGHLPPCHLCLQQRAAYWVAIGVSVAGLAISQIPLGVRLRPLICVILALVFLTGFAIAVRHAGAEWKWWPGPEGCSGSRAASSADLARLLGGGAMAAPRCDVAPWRLLGVSMAGWNALISLKMAVLSAVAASRARRPA